MRNRQQIGSEERRCSTADGRRRVVIADDGVTAALVIFDGSRSTAPGARFHHGGREWEIRGPRHGSGVLVAEPLDIPGQ